MRCTYYPDEKVTYSGKSIGQRRGGGGLAYRSGPASLAHLFTEVVSSMHLTYSENRKYLGLEKSS